MGAEEAWQKMPPPPAFYRHQHSGTALLFFINFPFNIIYPLPRHWSKVCIDIAFYGKNNAFDERCVLEVPPLTLMHTQVTPVSVSVRK